eukprot:CFRG1668T1
MLLVRQVTTTLKASAHQLLSHTPVNLLRTRRRLYAHIAKLSASSNTPQNDTASDTPTNMSDNNDMDVLPPPFKPSSVFKDFRFLNSALNALPVEDVSDAHSGSRSTPGAVWSRVLPTPVTKPTTVSVCIDALKLLDVPAPTTDEERDNLYDAVAEYFSGNALLPGMDPAAHCYAGTQFGNFAGQLGDGRAINLGEIINQKGERYELQLKGAGLTPYSRTADGRAVLRSSIREYICSEHMHALGIATSRAASLVTSETLVIRDPLYDGHPINERSTVVLRLAPSFIRFGSWEVFRGVDDKTGARGPSADPKYFPISHQMLDHVIATHYPEIWADHETTSTNNEERYISFFKELVNRTAETCAKWQGVGFVHGVLNTDNMSILGLTIDYGPYGFMDYFDLNMVPNHSDNTGRYRYQNQPGICKWNLSRLAESLDISGVICMTKLQPIIDSYDSKFKTLYAKIMRDKLGLYRLVEEADIDLIASLFKALHDTGCDMTLAFRVLSDVPVTSPSADNGTAIHEFIENNLLPLCCSSEHMAKRIRPDMSIATVERLIDLGEEKPEILLAYTGRPLDFFKQQLKLYDISKTMQEETVEVRNERIRELWVSWLPSYIDRIRNEAQAEPKIDIEKMNEGRIKRMSMTNPKYIFRNYLAQDAIELAEKGDFTEIERLMRVMCDPYGLDVDNDPEFDPSKYATVVPATSCDLVLSCSS